ncbi:MAG TPA: hypothetical protein VGL76_00615, partial [Gaiellaceae bacterium]
MERSPCKTGVSVSPRTGEILIEQRADTLLLSATSTGPKGEELHGVNHQIELTAEGLWEDVSARLRGALNEK